MNTGLGLWIIENGSTHQHARSNVGLEKELEERINPAALSEFYPFTEEQVT